MRKYRVLEKAPLPNGRIVIGPEPPCKQSVERYASTVHAFQGKDVQHKLFIDTRRMFEQQHWYTAVSRAQYLDQLILVDVPPPPPSEVYAKTIIYRIKSRNTEKEYIGHTTSTKEASKPVCSFVELSIR